MTRTKFESLVSSLVDRTITCCKQAVKDANINPSDVKEVIVTGGMTHMPLVLLWVMHVHCIQCRPLMLLGTKSSAGFLWDISNKVGGPRHNSSHRSCHPSIHFTQYNIITAMLLYYYH